MSLDQDIGRGQEANRILQSEIYRESFAEIERRLLNELAVIEIQPARAEYLRQLIVANRKIRMYLEQVMVTGQLSEQQQSLMERVKGKAKSPF